MPIPARISKYLDSQHIAYRRYTHSPAYTAQDIAHAQHVSGKELAKVVMVVADNKLVMTVVPASYRVDLKRLGQILNANTVRLATEEEFKDIFPECELGGMPPLGNLYSLEVWVDEMLRSHLNITFNAGTHEETIQISYGDFERLVQPKIASFGVLLH